MSLVGAILGAISGAIVGSFLATLVIRLPRGEQAVVGRSRCDRCQHALGPLELVPILSRLWLRGRCRACNAAIDPTHVQLEICAAIVGAAAMWLAPDASGLALALFGWLLLPLAWLDWRHLWLPDRLVLPLALGGLAFGGLLGASLVDRIIGGLTGWAALTLILLTYRLARGREGLGHGDPKLLGAIGLWLGWMPLAPLLALAAALGIAVALARGLSRKDSLPFGTMLAIVAWPIAWSQLAYVPAILS
ncbi:MAG TPA: prepilin peptidase [Sphingomicrobium sp.]|nr:prepilin peptidase [Sphingomicrobium sp.]